MKNRTTAELLASICQHCETEYYTSGLNDWHWAALYAMQDCEGLIETL